MHLQKMFTNASNTTSTDSNITQILYPVIYAIIVIIGFIGNTLVIGVVLQKPSMRTKTNLLLANLSLADLLTLIWSIPIEIFDRYNHPKGGFGTFLCRFLSVGGLVVITLIVSILLMTLIALERYHAMVLPFNRKKRLAKSKIGVVIVPTWIIALLCSLPIFIHTDYDIQTRDCVFNWESKDSLGYFIFLLICLFFIPLFVIYFCYFSIIFELNKQARRSLAKSARNNHDFLSKRKVICTLVTLSVIFTISFGIFAFERFLTQLELLPPNSVFSAVSFLFVYLPSATNPLIYVFQSSNYRRAFKEMASEMNVSKYSFKSHKIKNQETAI